MRVLIFAVLLFFFSFLSGAHAALESIELEHQGRDRQFLLHVPENLKGQSNIPVVLAMHGGGGNAEQFASHINMEATADKSGFIVVYLEGTSKRGRLKAWNAGKCCASAMKDNVDDVGYVSKVIDILTSQYGADPARIYATGHSNGGMMSYRLACELPDKIAAIAPNAGQDVTRESCKTGRTVPILHLHGKEDKCAAYYGGDDCGGCFVDVMRTIGVAIPENKAVGRWECQPVKNVVSDWAVRNGCSAETQVTFEKGDVQCLTYQECDADADVTLCSIEHAGHTWAGAEKNTPKMCKRRPNNALCKKLESSRGKVNYDINANEFMWDFFQKH